MPRCSEHGEMRRRSAPPRDSFMALAGSRRVSVRPATAFVTVLGVVVALLTGVLALAPTAGAATVYVGPNFGSFQPPPPIAPPDSNPLSSSNCPGAAAVTTLV